MLYKEEEHSFILGELGKFLRISCIEMDLKIWVWLRHAEM